MNQFQRAKIVISAETTKYRGIFVTVIVMFDVKNK